MLNNVTNSYSDDHQRRKGKPEKLDTTKLMTDRSTYITYLESQLDRVTSACMAVQSFDHRIEAAHGHIRSLEDKVLNVAKLVRSQQACVDEADDTFRKTASQLADKQQLVHDLLFGTGAAEGQPGAGADTGGYLSANAQRFLERTFNQWVAEQRTELLSKVGEVQSALQTQMNQAIADMQNFCTNQKHELQSVRESAADRTTAVEAQLAAQNQRYAELADVRLPGFEEQFRSELKSVLADAQGRWMAQIEAVRAEAHQLQCAHDAQAADQAAGMQRLRHGQDELLRELEHMREIVGLQVQGRLALPSGAAAVAAAASNPSGGHSLLEAQRIQPASPAQPHFVSSPSLRQGSVAAPSEHPSTPTLPRHAHQDDPAPSPMWSLQAQPSALPAYTPDTASVVMNAATDAFSGAISGLRRSMDKLGSVLESRVGAAQITPSMTPSATSRASTGAAAAVLDRLADPASVHERHHGTPADSMAPMASTSQPQTSMPSRRSSVADVALRQHSYPAEPPPPLQQQEQRRVAHAAAYDTGHHYNEEEDATGHASVASFQTGNHSQEPRWSQGSPRLTTEAAFKHHPHPAEPGRPEHSRQSSRSAHSSHPDASRHTHDGVRHLPVSRSAEVPAWASQGAHTPSGSARAATASGSEPYAVEGQGHVVRASRAASDCAAQWHDVHEHFAEPRVFDDRSSDRLVVPHTPSQVGAGAAEYRAVNSSSFAFHKPPPAEASQHVRNRGSESHAPSLAQSDRTHRHISDMGDGGYNQHTDRQPHHATPMHHQRVSTDVADAVSEHYRAHERDAREWQQTASRTADTARDAASVCSSVPTALSGLPFAAYQPHHQGASVQNLAYSVPEAMSQHLSRSETAPGPPRAVGESLYQHEVQRLVAGQRGGRGGARVSPTASYDAPGAGSQPWAGGESEPHSTSTWTQMLGPGSHAASADDLAHVDGSAGTRSERHARSSAHHRDGGSVSGTSLAPSQHVSLPSQQQQHSVTSASERASDAPAGFSSSHMYSGEAVKRHVDVLTSADVSVRTSSERPIGASSHGCSTVAAVHTTDGSFSGLPVYGLLEDEEDDGGSRQSKAEVAPKKRARRVKPAQPEARQHGSQAPSPRAQGLTAGAPSASGGREPQDDGGKIGCEVIPEHAPQPAGSKKSKKTTGTGKSCKRVAQSRGGTSKVSPVVATGRRQAADSKPSKPQPQPRFATHTASSALKHHATPPDALQDPALDISIGRSVPVTPNGAAAAPRGPGERHVRSRQRRSMDEGSRSRSQSPPYAEPTLATFVKRRSKSPGRSFPGSRDWGQHRVAEQEAVHIVIRPEAGHHAASHAHSPVPTERARILQQDMGRIQTRCALPADQPS